MGKYIEQVAVQVGRLQEVVNGMVGVLQPAFPMPPPVVWPPGPWGLFGTVGRAEGLEEGKDDRGV